MSTLAELFDLLAHIADKKTYIRDTIWRHDITYGQYLELCKNNKELFDLEKIEEEVENRAHDLFKEEFDYCHVSANSGYCDICHGLRVIPVFVPEILPRRSTRVKKQREFYYGF
jgi:hypothetical protein